MSVLWSYPNIFNLNDIDEFIKSAFTKREKQIIDLLRCGFKDKYIAGKLFISLPTARKHLRVIYEKIGVSSKSEFIAIYYCIVQSKSVTKLYLLYFPFSI